MAAHQHLFVSYASGDIDKVKPIVEAIEIELKLRDLNVDLWMDVQKLNPGEHWEAAISDALQVSLGFIFFLSPSSLDSVWIKRELHVAGSDKNRLIIPIILRHGSDVPDLLKERQWLDLSGETALDEIGAAVQKIADSIQDYLHQNIAAAQVVSKLEAPKLAADFAKELRESSQPKLDSGSKNSVFVVHGHSEVALNILEDFLTTVQIESVVLSRNQEASQSLFQKFMSVASKAKFAVVLLSADDYGASRIQFDAEGVAERALQFRSRQNVVLELGFFYGRLGWENVFVVYEGPDKVFPNFERPSDLDGVVFDSMSESGWQSKLAKKLTDAGFKMNEFEF